MAADFNKMQVKLWGLMPAGAIDWDAVMALITDEINGDDTILLEYLMGMEQYGVITWNDGAGTPLDLATWTFTKVTPWAPVYSTVASVIPPISRASVPI